MAYYSGYSPDAEKIYRDVVKTILNCWRQDPDSFSWSPSVDRNGRVLGLSKVRENIQRVYGIYENVLLDFTDSDTAYVNYFLDKYIKNKLYRDYNSLNPVEKALELKNIVDPVAEQVIQAGLEEHARLDAQFSTLRAAREARMASRSVRPVSPSRSIRPVMPAYPSMQKQALTAQIEQLEQILANLKSIRDRL